MSIRKLRAGRVPSVTAQQYIGERGSIFWNELTGEFRLSNGVTPGGSPVGFPVASSTEIGGLKLGPGTLLNNDNQLIIDSTGLSFNFGDFQATTPSNGAATLSSIQPDQDIAIVSNGTGVINMVGDFHIHRTQDYNPSLPDVDGAVFAVKSDGQIQMKIPLADVTTGALEIIGNDSGLFMAPNQTGVILHVTGNSGLVSRNYFDANANYVILAGRRYNGTQLAPRRVLNNETLLRIVSQGATATNNSSDATFQTFGPARISFYANEDQTPTAQGGRIAFEVTKNGFVADGTGTNTITAAYIDAQNGITATKFNGPLTGNVTGKANTAGNADTVTNGVYTTDTGTVTNTMLAGSIANNKLSNSSVTVNGTSIALGASATVTAAAGTLTGTTLNSTVVTSSLTSVGTLTNLTVTNAITGSVSGSAGSVAAANITGTTLASNVVTSSLTSVGTLTNLAIASGGTITAPRMVVNDGGLRTVNGGTTLTIDFATDTFILWTAPSGTAVITLANRTAGARVKLMIAMTTSRDVTYGISAAANSSTGATSFNGAGGGSVDISNTTMFLDYVCMSDVVGGCYLAVTVL
jgi:hypothetical protein